eukprot:GHVR01028840.1.p1 GENE.GHVR01028840.1~~GHVR01028840.1.p1  ORF type:complete len:183 (-),score=7.57 GHVR01028840.1:2752-3300(-)
MKENLVKILLKADKVGLDGIKQFTISMKEDSQKFGTLIQLYKNLIITQCIVFTNRKETVSDLTEKLKSMNFVVSCLKGDMDEADRQETMKEFRSGKSRILIATDIIGRGIDVQQVDLVINYDLPYDDDSQYIHRIGRTGRFGKKGVAINFITEGNANFISRVQTKYGIKMEELPLDLSKIYS